MAVTPAQVDAARQKQLTLEQRDFNMHVRSSQGELQLLMRERDETTNALREVEGAPHAPDQIKP